MEFSKEEIIKEMNRTGIIPVFYHENIEIAKAVLEASYKGGVRVFEFTNRGKNAFDVFVELVRIAGRLPGFILGIGTIMNVDDADKFIKSGAKFIVSPILKIELAKVCKSYDKLWIPGTATLTEIVTAKEAGAEVIKIFPGNVLGPKFVSAVLPVVPGLRLMPTGGVEPTEGNLKEWFDAGVFCVGLGSQLFSKKITEEKNWVELEARISDTIRTVTQVRPNSIQF